MLTIYDQPRLFRDALGRSIEEQVDELLLDFAQHAFGRSDADPPPPFILFYFSDHMLYSKLRTLGESQNDDGSLSGVSSPPGTTTAAARSGPLGALGFRSPLALGLSSATVSPRHVSTPNAESGAAPTRMGRTWSHSTMSFRSVFASTRSLFPGPGSRAGGGDISQHQRDTRRKTKKKKKNAVMNYADPQEFQRVVQVPTASSGAVAVDSQRHETGAPDAGGVPSVGSTDVIAFAVVLFVKEVVPLFFAGASKSKRRPSQMTAQAVELKHIRWENFPLETPAPTESSVAMVSRKRTAVTNLTAWKHGNCLLIYPDHESKTSFVAAADDATATAEKADAITSLSVESTRLRRLRDRKAAVRALFNALEPLAQALMIGRT